MNPTHDGILNAMTVDVEEHFQVTGFEKTVRREDWATIPSRVVDNTARLLDLFDETEIKSTFFILGWLAERHAALVRRIAERGHEVASHGYSHRLAYTQTAQEFREETLRSKKLLEDAAGQPVVGYRAASFSIDRRNLWALDILAETGFSYDSSLFPVIHDRYGVPGAPRHPFRVKTSGSSLLEVPPSTLRFGRAVLPVAGGGYLRLYPLAFTRWAIAHINQRERMPVVVYVHPWETDPEQPRIDGPAVNRFRHYVGLAGTLAKLRSITARFRFGPMAALAHDGDRFPEMALS